MNSNLSSAKNLTLCCFVPVRNGLVYIYIYIYIYKCISYCTNIPGNAMNINILPLAMSKYQGGLSSLTSLWQAF